MARSPSINIVSPPGSGEAAENITSRRTPLSTPGLSEKGEESSAAFTPDQRDDVPTPTTSPVRRRRSPSRSRSPPPRRHRYDEAERRRTPPMRGSPGRAAPPPLLQAAGSGGPPRPRPVVDMSVPPPGLMHSTSLPAVAGIIQCTWYRYIYYVPYRTTVH